MFASPLDLFLWLLPLAPSMEATEVAECSLWPRPPPPPPPPPPLLLWRRWPARAAAAARSEVDILVVGAEGLEEEKESRVYANGFNF